MFHLRDFCHEIQWDSLLPLVNFKWVIYQGFRIFGISKNIFCHVIMIMIHMSCDYLSIYPYIHISTHQSIYPHINPYIYISKFHIVTPLFPIVSDIVSTAQRSWCERFAASPSSDSNRPKVSVNPAPRQRLLRRAFKGLHHGHGEGMYRTCNMYNIMYIHIYIMVCILYVYVYIYCTIYVYIMFWCSFIVPVAWDAVARPKCHWENEVLIHWNCVFFQ